MPRIGYARVSTLDQDFDVQLARLQAEGCAIIRSEKVSGGSREGRVELATILAFLRPDDKLVGTHLDRLGRDTRAVLNLIHEAEERGASVTVLDPHVSTRGEMGQVVLTVSAWSLTWSAPSSRSASVRASHGRRLKGRTRAGSAASTAIKCERFMRLIAALPPSRRCSAAHGCKSTASCRRHES